MKKKTLQQRLEEEENIITQRLIDRQQKSDEKYKSNIKKRVEAIVEATYAYYFTYTFDNENIDKYSEYTHIKKIRATLSQATSYLINNDYGDLNDRYHYHALASFSHEYNTTLLNTWQYGYTDIERIKDKNSKAIYEYILKLTNHAIKKSVAKIWRSRNKNV